MRRAPITRDCAAKSSPNLRTILLNPKLRGRVLADIRDEQPCNPISQAAAGDHRYEGDNPFRVERVIREVRLRDRFDIKLLPLRFDTSRFERSERRRQRLFAEF